MTSRYKLNTKVTIRLQVCTMQRRTFLKLLSTLNNSQLFAQVFAYYFCQNIATIRSNKKRMFFDSLEYAERATSPRAQSTEKRDYKIEFPRKEHAEESE